MKTQLLVLLIPLFCCCSGMEKAEKEKIRKRNASSEKILRCHDDVSFAIPQLQKKKKKQYPWEKKLIGAFPRITKEHFRCKGSLKNQERVEYDIDDKPIYYIDCGGIDRHGLPVRDQKEFIYPILIDLLNFIQEKTKKQVVITTGHRCPMHHGYVDSSKENRTSKHLVGAEVDFYVKGLEESPEEIIKILMQYYSDDEDPSYATFIKCLISSDHLSYRWYNKEVSLRIHEKDEGRDLDNQHPYPYITIELRFDRELQQRVLYSWHQAHNGYFRN